MYEDIVVCPDCMNVKNKKREGEWQKPLDYLKTMIKLKKAGKLQGDLDIEEVICCACRVLREGKVKKHL